MRPGLFGWSAYVCDPGRALGMRNGVTEIVERALAMLEDIAEITEQTGRSLDNPDEQPTRDHTDDPA